MITKDYIAFFKELEENNHKEWFHANKKRYEQHVKQPFHQLVNELIEVLKDIDPDIPADPKAIIMRINRDIRFSKDKQPYNLLMKANFTPGGRKSPNPGFYLGIGADHLHIGGGLYQSSPQELKAIRRYMVHHAETIQQILGGKDFRTAFGEVRGAKAKRLDREWTEMGEQLPLLYHKQFFYMKQMPINDFLNMDIASSVLPVFNACAPIHNFLKEAVNSQ